MTRIHVRRDIIARDKKLGTRGNALGVETSGKRKRYGTSVTTTGPVRFIYRPEQPLSCGARAWAETAHPVVVHRARRGTA